jgi:hypothetical protein
MSLNRIEQSLFDYIKRHPEERQYIQEKVRSISAAAAGAEGAVARIDSELWRYYEERSSQVPEFRETARAYGPGRTSMKNLAEHLVRIWTEPRPGKTARPGNDGHDAGK